MPRPDDLEPFRGLIQDELNVKRLTLVDLETASEADFGITQRLTVNARAAGPRLGREVQQAIKGSKTGDWSIGADGVVTSGGLALVEGEFTLETVVAGGAADSRATAMLQGGGFVVLDTTVTPELAAEGVARDLVRAVQQARRDAGLHVSDRISLTIQGSPEVFEATVTHRDLIVGETLATQFASGPMSTNGSAPATPCSAGAVDVVVGDNQPATILVVKR